MSLKKHRNRNEYCNVLSDSITNPLNGEYEMKQLTKSLFVLSLALNTMAFAADGVKSQFNVDSDHVILEGYDVVSYFNQPKPVKSDPKKPKIEVNRDGVVYRFVSEENKQTFLKDPKKYEPQFGGWCAYAVAEKKEKVEVDPESYLIQDGRLLLFYNSVFARTRKLWESKDGVGKEAYLKLADKNWPEVLQK